MDDDLYRSIAVRYRRGCVFCDPHPAMMWGRSGNFGVCFDVAPLVPGHLIIFSDEHHGCAGEVPPELFPELASVRAEVRRALRAAWGAVTFYEHGRAGHCLTDGPEHRLCHHFHLHCVPIDEDVVVELADRFTVVPVAAYEELPATYARYGDYLYLETDAGQASYLVVDHEIERHLLRTLIAKRVGHQERADWREYTDRSLLDEGMRALGTARRPLG